MLNNDGSFGKIFFFIKKSTATIRKIFSGISSNNMIYINSIIESSLLLLFVIVAAVAAIAVVDDGVEIFVVAIKSGTKLPMT